MLVASCLLSRHESSESHLLLDDCVVLILSRLPGAAIRTVWFHREEDSPLDGKAHHVVDQLPADPLRRSPTFQPICKAACADSSSPTCWYEFARGTKQSRAAPQRLQVPARNAASAIAAASATE